VRREPVHGRWAAGELRSRLSGVTRTGCLVVAALALAGLTAGCSSTETVTTTVTVTTTAAEPAPPRRRAEFGHIDSLVRKGGRWEMRFDPAWFLSGETANRAAAEDGVVPPGEPVPNDNYRVEEGHRLLTYLVSPSATVTVLVRSPSGFAKAPISVGQLARLVDGEKVPGVTLYEPLDSGVWITYEIDTVRKIDQQYLP
jgi:hypothetical protein